jgi:hypothetical protein
MEDKRVSIAESLALRDRHIAANRVRWQKVYQHRYQKDECYASHEHVAATLYFAFYFSEKRTASIISDNEWANLALLASESWFGLGMPSWWVTQDVVELVKDTKNEVAPLEGSDLPDDTGLVMLPRGVVSVRVPKTEEDVEITALLFARHSINDSEEDAPKKKDGLLLTFLTEDAKFYSWAYLLGTAIADDSNDMESDIVPTLQALARFAILLLQIIHAAKPQIKESVELTPSKIKHHQVRPALWSRRIVGEGFRYSRKPHQGGTHTPPRLHRRKAHTKGVWVGHGEDRHLEDRKIAATWVADGSLSAEEKQQLIGLLGNRFQDKADPSAKEMRIEVELSPAESQKTPA